MAQKAIQEDGMKFCCSICLDLLKDPVTIPCGHNYCLSCVKRFWDEDQKKTVRCPQCQQTFTPRPALVKNTMLADLVEELKTTGLQASPDDHMYAGAGDVACDVCTGRKWKALKSCLVCLASYCEQHLQPHRESPAFKKHKLVEASLKLHETVCPRHDEAMKIFCRTDQQCICYLCSMDEHRGHDVVSAAAERTERQKKLEEHLQNLQRGIQERERHMTTLQQQVETIKRSADKAFDKTEKLLTELICALERMSSGVKQEIRDRQESEAGRAKQLQQTLRDEIAELQRKEAQLKQLSRTEDPTEFLHGYSSLSQLTEPTEPQSTKPNQQQHFDDMTAAVAATAGKIHTVLNQAKLLKTSVKETDGDMLLTPAEPRTRAEFLSYSCHVTMDPDTAGGGLLLSNGDRKVVKTDGLSQSTHPGRFAGLSQVMSTEALTGRSYWEVEKRGRVSVAVTYKDVSRTGDFTACAFGYNKKSWALTYDNSYTFRHGTSSPTASHQPSRIGVYLDHGAGTLCFYSVSEDMTLLHRVQTSFSQPLHVGLWLHGSDGDSAEFCELV